MEKLTTQIFTMNGTQERASYTSKTSIVLTKKRLIQKLFRIAAICLMAISFSGPVTAAPEDGVITSYGEPGCDSVTASNWFDLGPGEEFQFVIDCTECEPEWLGRMIYNGNIAKKNSGPQLQPKDRVYLAILDMETGEEIAGGMGRVDFDVESPRDILLSARNTNRNKTVTIRLRTTGGF